MSILRFRITFDDYDDIQRDIDFKADQTFADLYNELLKSVGFDQKHKGTFWIADHNWRKGALIGEITGEAESVLRKTELVEHIDDPHQKFLFSYDENVGWNFNIELIRVMANGEYKAVYPKISAQSGIPPVQYKETLIIPTRERSESDGRGRKPRIKDEDEDELSKLLASMAGDDEELDDVSPDAELGEEPGETAEIEIPADIDLETDTEIAKLAEEFNNTIETGGDDTSNEDDDDGYGGYGDDDDEYGNNDDDDEYGSGRRGGGYGGDYDE
ncbi:MAG: IS1096 element passenger TnpR family protein [Bacteroidia bacterium]